jgi:farnesyl-diphosphate farnesyltransferase
MVNALGLTLFPLLREVSRSFYLTLRILPRQIRHQMGLAYLLARTTDTIADTALIPLEERLAALQHLRQRILGSDASAIDFGELARHQGSAGERALLINCEASLALLRNLEAKDQDLVRQVLQTIISGQELDLHRFAAANANHIIALKTGEDLDDYTYRVAGCVGEFWTRICRAHMFPNAALDDTALFSNAVRFGKGLQLVNVLRDLPVDLRQGRCYMPASELAPCGLTPEDLLNAENVKRLQPVYNRWLALAESNLRAGWAYTNMLPRSCVRVRLACAWPLLIGRDTLNLLRMGNVLDAEKRLKVSRRRVRSIITRSVITYPWRRAWENLYPESNASPRIQQV